MESSIYVQCYEFRVKYVVCLLEAITGTNNFSGLTGKGGIW